MQYSVGHYTTVRVRTNTSTRIETGATIYADDAPQAGFYIFELYSTLTSVQQLPIISFLHDSLPF